MDMCPTRVDVITLYDRVVAGLEDDNSVRSLCYLMLFKLITVAPEETSVRLDELAAKFRIILGEKTKENAVRHEMEKLEEGKKGVVKISLELNRAFPGESSSGLAGQPSGRLKWSSYLDDMKKEQMALIKDMEKESKEKERA